MTEKIRSGRTRSKKTARWIVAGVVLCSAMTSVAPVVYASDCSRWVAEYKQGILQRRAARRLQAAKYRLTTLVQKPQPVHRHPSRRPMGPLEALRRFQIDCGDLETPDLAPKAPSVPLVPKPLLVEFPEVPPPDVPFGPVTEVAEAVPPLVDVPTTTTPVEAVPTPGPVPEPSSFILMLTGAGIAAGVIRKRPAGSNLHQA